MSLARFAIHRGDITQYDSQPQLFRIIKQQIDMNRLARKGLSMLVDIETLVSIVLGIASATLAIAAFIFSWASYKSSSKMQIKAQDILAQISQKVEVVNERTSHQMDKAWDYFISNSQSISLSGLSESKEDEIKSQNELIERIKEEARQEAREVINKSGISREEGEELIAKVNTLLDKNTERSKEVIDLAELNVRLEDIAQELILIANKKNYLLPVMFTHEYLFNVLPSMIDIPNSMVVELRKLYITFTEIKNDAFYNVKTSAKKIAEEINRANIMLTYLRLQH